MDLKDKRVAVLTEEKYEDLELWYPVLRLREAGAEVVLVGSKPDHVYTSKHGYPAKSDRAIGEIKSEDFDGCVVPGGFSPDYMRRDPAFRQAVRRALDDQARHAVPLERAVAKQECRLG